MLYRNPISDFVAYIRHEPKLLEYLEECTSGNEIAETAKQYGYIFPRVDPLQEVGHLEFDLAPLYETVFDYHTCYHGPHAKELHDYITKKQKIDELSSQNIFFRVFGFLSKIKANKQVKLLTEIVEYVNPRARIDAIRTHQIRLMLGLPHTIMFPWNKDIAGVTWYAMSHDSRQCEHQIEDILNEIGKLRNAVALNLVGDTESHLLRKHFDRACRLLQVISIIEWEQKMEELYPEKEVDDSIPPPRWVRQALSTFRHEYKPFEEYDSFSLLHHEALRKDLPARCKPLGG